MFQKLIKNTYETLFHKEKIIKEKEISEEEIKEYIRNTLEKKFIFKWTKEDPLKRYSDPENYTTEIYGTCNQILEKVSNILKKKNLELEKRKSFEDNEYQITYNEKTIKWSITRIVKTIILIIEE